MKILITGSNGQLGYHLKRVFAGHDLFLGTVENYDITNEDLVKRETERFQPDVIIHAAAYTQVDRAELDRDLCWKINVAGTRHVAEAAKAIDAKLVAISTDYVFSGDKGTPYVETDKPNPLSYYGRTKYEAEQIVATMAPKHFICRTSWLYGGPKPMADFDYTVAGLPKNFVYTMLQLGKRQPAVEVVADQIGTPTYAQDLAEAIKELVGTIQYGVYHTTGSGQVSWADFAKEIFHVTHYPTQVTPITTDQWLAKHPNTTKRPMYSVLAHEHLLSIGLPEMRQWQEALADFLSELRG